MRTYPIITNIQHIISKKVTVQVFHRLHLLSNIYQYCIDFCFSNAEVDTSFSDRHVLASNLSENVMFWYVFDQKSNVRFKSEITNQKFIIIILLFGS